MQVGIARKVVYGLLTHTGSTTAHPRMAKTSSMAVVNLPAWPRW